MKNGRPRGIQGEQAKSAPVRNSRTVSMHTEWTQDAAERYDACNRATLNWLMARGDLGGGFLNTKVHSITGNDYDAASGARGPDYTYGWIQGRGLEALASFTMHYKDLDSAFSDRLRETGAALYRRLAEKQAGDGHAYFLYGPDGQPVIAQDGAFTPQAPAGSVYTYSDSFVSKGLFAASHLYEPEMSGNYLIYLKEVIAAVEDGRFQMDETKPLSQENIAAEPDDFGPRMILLAASGLLHRLGYSEETDFADRFIAHVLDRHFDPDSGLLLTIHGEDTCNVGHAIEFCGFAFEHLAVRPDQERLDRIVDILLRCMEIGMQGPGIALYLSASSGALKSPYFPWWPMPEAIRACALGYQLTGDSRLIAPWKKADAAFFSQYWRQNLGFAYQTRTVDGPVDFVPATPDLDPGYHTGLSLLAAIRSAGR
ncbi:hypothetical protein [Ponticoccus litoralis]|uniref:N-acylglucosamine 2-epimerase n=1 Tax=Ponticoccus litoralis TaxID=422297 RepID=A0AAW9SW29_9RHOB